MKVKPKEVLLNLPIVLGFKDYEQIPEFCANINTLLHGKVKIKYEELGLLGDDYMGIFYLQRNDEFSELRAEFKQMIEQEEMHGLRQPPVTLSKEEKLEVVEAVSTMQDEGGTPTLHGGEK